MPLYITNWTQLQTICTNNNPLELSPQLARFINRIGQNYIADINVYADAQNVHNSGIQQYVKDSIYRLTTQVGIPKFNIDILNTMILSDNILSENSKTQLIEYCSDDTVYSLLLLTFCEVLWYILHTINNNFNISDQNEIKQILNQELIDSECKCFTGRINRIINCLNGFCPLVQINISNSEQIGNIIILERRKLESIGSYSAEQLKLNVKHALLDRGYDTTIITQWLEYID